MIQYIIVFAIVAIAGIYVVRKLIGQAKGSGCSGDCHCALKEDHYKAGAGHAMPPIRNERKYYATCYKNQKGKP